MHQPSGQPLAGRPSPSQLPPDLSRTLVPSPSESQPSHSQSEQSQLPLGLAPTGDFDFVRERVRKDALDKWDALTPRALIRLHNGRVWFPEAAQSDFGAGFLQPTGWAIAQFCQRLGIPSHYFRRCPAVLQDFQFNHWIQANGQGADKQGPEDGYDLPEPMPSHLPGASNSEITPEPESAGRWLLRCQGDALRGVLSERYSPLDNDCLLDCLARVLPHGFQVDWFSLSDESLHLRLVDTRTPRQVLPGDDLMVGLHVGNSEVGKRAVTVDALIYRLVCQNGLIRMVRGKSLLHQRHLYLSAPRFQEALHGAVLGALSAAASFVVQLEAATRTPVPDVRSVLEMLGKQEALSKSFLEAVETSLKSEPSCQQETVWGLANGLTQAAQRLPADERYGVEALAGRLIESGPPKVLSPKLTASKLTASKLTASKLTASKLFPSVAPLSSPVSNGTRTGNGQDRNGQDRNGREPVSVP